jgi:hypothetical protein
MNLTEPNLSQLLSIWKPMLDHCTKISEWTEPVEIAWLAEAAKQHTFIAEVGSYKGKSAKAMAWECPGKIICVDSFHDPIRETGENGNEVKATFEQNLKYELETGKVTLVQLTSTAGAQFCKTTYGPAPFDMIFLDASHDKENVRKDLEAWLPLLKPGGLFCGHDYQHAQGGVKAAIQELKLETQIVCGSIWIKQQMLPGPYRPAA